MTNFELEEAKIDVLIAQARSERARAKAAKATALGCEALSQEYIDEMDAAANVAELEASKARLRVRKLETQEKWVPK